MKLEDLEQEIESIRSHSPDCADAEFAQKYMPKLFAVAEEAKQLLSRCQCCDAEELERALDDLESD